jgi:hypothetical protein
MGKVYQEFLSGRFPNTRSYLPPVVTGGRYDLLVVPLKCNARSRATPVFTTHHYFDYPQNGQRRGYAKGSGRNRKLFEA